MHKQWEDCILRTCYIKREREKELEKKNRDRRKRNEELSFKMKKITNILLRETEKKRKNGEKEKEDLQIFSRVTLFSYPHVKKR